jgi:predicted P-loop ATPase
MKIRDEAKRYFDLGLNVHWLRKHSKAPLEEGWAGRAKRKWKELDSTYSKNLGVGAQTGNAAEISGGLYLAMLDVDLKSKQSHHIAEAFAEVNRLFQNAFDTAPCVKSPNGVRYLFLTKKPYASRKLLRSSERVKVSLPTDRATDAARKRAIATGEISAEDWDKGMRIRPAWEIELMSNGKQGVLPPTIHPDTGVPYVWLVPLESIEDLPIIGNKKLSKALERAGLSDGPGAEFDFASDTPAPFTFTPTEVDLECSIAPPALVRLIVDGVTDAECQCAEACQCEKKKCRCRKECQCTGVSDNSAALFSAAMHLKRLGFSDDEILTVLTDEANYLGRVGYEHTGSKKRWRAARWVEKYTLRRAEYNVSAEKAFEDPPLAAVRLSKEEAKEQEAAIKKDGSWRRQLKRKPVSQAAADRGEQGPILSLIENMVLILENDVHPQIVRRNEFTIIDVLGAPPPWREAGEGAHASDDDVPAICYWCSMKYGFEPSRRTVEDALNVIAVKNKFHPVQERLEALPSWDGVMRLDTWLTDHFGAENDAYYVGEVFRKFMVAAVARVYEPGTKFDWMIVLEGLTGMGKTYFGDILFGEEFYLDGIPPIKDNKEAVGLIQGAHCAEFGELSSLRSVDINVIKSFLSRRFDKVRLPYARRWSSMGRQTVFIGTTEDSEFLKADEANRRFMPIKVGRLNVSQLKRDRDQLWAEALHIYQMGLEPMLFLSREAEAIAREVRAEKTIEDTATLMKQAFISTVLDDHKNGAKPAIDYERFTMSEVCGGVARYFEKWGIGPATTQYASKALKLIGAKKYSVKGNRYWKIDPEIIKNIINME